MFAASLYARAAAQALLAAYVRLRLAARELARGWLPTTVLRVDYVAPTHHDVRCLYHWLWRSRWPAGLDLAADPHGVYAVEAWDGAEGRRATYLLSAPHLAAALPLLALWAYTDAGLVHFLAAYVAEHGAEPDCFDVRVGDAPASRALRPVARCLGMADNVTAAALALWFAWRHQRPYAATVTVTDEDLNDVALAPTAYLARAE